MRRSLWLLIILFLTLAPSAWGQIEEIESGGVTRMFIAYAPTDLPSPAPLVFVLHGAWNNGTNFRRETGFDAIADEGKFVVVYPFAITRVLGQDWEVSGMEDVEFILDLVELMKQRYPIDPKRIYATGFSMGGYMSHHLACNASDVFAAVVPVSGHCLTVENVTKPCVTSRPLSVLMIHGTADPVVWYNLTGDDVDGWLERNGGCPSLPEITDPYPADNPDSLVTKESYGPCNRGTEVVLMSVEGLGHFYPGGNGAEDADISAAEEAWNFLKQFDLDGRIQPEGYRRVQRRRASAP